MSSRLHAERRQALVSRLDDGELELRSPTVALWRGAPQPGTVITQQGSLGELEVLGVLSPLVAPAGVSGVVTGEARRGAAAKRPVEYGEVLLRLAPLGALGNAEERAPGEASASTASWVFRAPTSGRFYVRPAPDQPAFVTEGAHIERGHTTCLLEVMKTFNRIQLSGDELPQKVRVLRIVPADGDDVEQGDPLLELGPA
ncbi:MAG: hypothetical protein KIT72_15070 [Polyangiaceae bacterium]|nr:hypothetical protein [Polyangiaceae bacterium]MCW5791738.1 hypothetical protein [Polyangiaceae bacterium]